MRKFKDKTAERNIFNSNFLVYVSIILGYILLNSIAIYVDKKTVIEVPNNGDDVISGFVQLQATISTLVITMISIISTFQQSNAYGINIKDIFNLRKGFYLNLLNTIISLLILTVFSVVGLLYELFWFSLLQVSLSIIICVWISIQDVPLIFHDDKALVRLLKRNLDLNTNPIDDNILYRENYNNIIIKLIEKKGLTKVYQYLKDIKTTSNKELLNYLCTLLMKHLNNLPIYKQGNQELSELVDINRAILNNAKSLFDHKSIFMQDEDISTSDLTLYLSRLLYYCHNFYEYLDEKTKDNFDTIFNSLFIQMLGDNKTAEISYNTIRSLIKTTIMENDLWVVEFLKKEYSNWKYSFYKHKKMLLIFLEISYVLYIYYNYEDLIEDDFKKKIKKCVTTGTKISVNYRTLSWNHLFKYAISKLNINFEDLQTEVVVDNWEYMMLNEAKSCIMTESSLFYWWLMCIFESDILYNYDFTSLNNMNEECKTLAAHCLDVMFENKNVLNLDNLHCEKFCDFYGLSNKRFNHICRLEKIKKALFDFKNNYKKIEKIKEAEEIALSSEKLEELKKYLQTELDKKLKSSIFYTPSLSLDNIEPRGIYNLEELFDDESSKNLYLNLLQDCFTSDFHQIFETEFENKFIDFSTTTSKTNLNKFIKLAPTMSVLSDIYDIENYTNVDSDKKKKLSTILDNIETIENDFILPSDYYYFTDGAIRFNYDFHSFDLKPLEEEHLIKCVDKKRAEDGMYYHNGVQYTFEELKSILQKTYFTMKVFVKYRIDIDHKKILLLDPYLIKERNKNEKTE